MTQRHHFPLILISVSRTLSQTKRTELLNSGTEQSALESPEGAVSMKIQGHIELESPKAALESAL